MQNAHMKAAKLKFNVKDQPEFFKELHRRVNGYFKERKISKHANTNMKLKTVFMVSSYFVPMFILISGVVTNVWFMYLLWILMGFGMSGIGLSVMHDANHGAYSSNKKVNTALGFLLNFVGGYPANWRIQHNVLHHSYTNVHGYDEDIDKGIIRFSPNQERKGMFRFQALYAPLLYGLMTIYWFLAKDYVQLYKYNRQDLLKTQNLTFGRAFLGITFHKTWYVLLTIVMPLIVLPFHWSAVILGFVLMHLICGWILAAIFQPAHVVEETQFFKPSDEGNVENNWAIHQLLTTANFANKNKLFTWLVGGLNFQIEHHLFPNICHIHYDKISVIVKETAQEYGIPYHSHDTFYGAVKSHFTLLHELGTGEYDRKLKAA